jgi:hypothetical protein
MLQKLFYKLVVVTALTLPIFGSVQVAKAQSTYGATAYSSTTDATGISWDHATQKEALDSAVAICNEHSQGAEDCKALSYNRNNCGAIAVGKGGAAQAIAACSELDGGNCKVELSACNN